MNLLKSIVCNGARDALVTSVIASVAVVAAAPFFFSVVYNKQSQYLALATLTDAVRLLQSV